MKWDLFELIVNKDGCLQHGQMQKNILGVSVPPMASPLTVLWTLRPKDAVHEY